MVGTLKKAIKKTALSENSEWNACVTQVLVGYHRRPWEDGSSPFKLLFGTKPRFVLEPPNVDLVSWSVRLVREFKFDGSRSIRASRAVSVTNISPVYKVGERVKRRKENDCRVLD